MHVAAPVVPTSGTRQLSLPRLHAMRAGYLLMGVGLVIVKWPLLAEAHDLPLYEGVTLCLLTAMSLLAFLGLRYPVKLLPVLLFEATWKVLWLALVALPTAVDTRLDTATTDVAVNCSLVVVIIAVIPWRYVWHTYARAPGDRWRSPGPDLRPPHPQRQSGAPFSRPATPSATRRPGHQKTSAEGVA